MANCPAQDANTRARMTGKARVYNVYAADDDSFLPGGAPHKFAMRRAGSVQPLDEFQAVLAQDCD